MPEKPSITHAYCVELGEVVSITDARRAYFARPVPRARFQFLCSSQSCLDLNDPPHVTGVNYSHPPTDTYRAAHFRENPSDKHAPDCVWMADEEAEGANDKLAGGSDGAANTRQAKRKLNDWINEFDPTLLAATASRMASGAGADLTANARLSRKGISKGEGRTSNNRTRSFDRLVEFYRDAQQALTRDEFQALTLRVVGEGEMPLTSYFLSLSQAKLGVENRVIYGGALLDDRTGTGFRLWFYDRISKLRVYLGVTRAQMDAYRFREMLNQALDQQDADYIRVFALGRLVPSPTGKSVKLEIDDLKQLALIAVKKEPPTYPANQSDEIARKG